MLICVSRHFGKKKTLNFKILNIHLGPKTLWSKVKNQKKSTNGNNFWTDFENDLCCEKTNTLPLRRDTSSISSSVPCRGLARSLPDSELVLKLQFELILINACTKVSQGCLKTRAVRKSANKNGTKGQKLQRTFEKMSR